MAAMKFVTNDPRKVSDISGFDSWYHSLPPKLGIDQFRTVLPLLVSGGADGPILIAKEIDRTNLQALELDGLGVVFHSPYFSFDRYDDVPMPAIYADVYEAFDAVVGDAAKLDPDLSISLYERLRARLAGSPAVQATAFRAPLNHYVISRQSVLEARQASHERGARIAATYLPEMPDAVALKEWLQRPTGDSLRVLDDLLAEHGIDVLVASSPINVQHLTGVPAGVLGEDVWAVYERAAADVHLLARREIPWSTLPIEQPASRDFVLGRARRGRIGYEELDLTARAYFGFGLDSADSVAASLTLRRWREVRGWEDLGFYIVGAQATRRGIDAAMQTVLSAVNGEAPVTELDAYEAYRATVAAELARSPIRLNVRTYFTHTHGGNRTHIPARATVHSLRPLTSLKMDAGLEIYDHTWSLRAVSDITRSALGTPGGAAFYDLASEGLVNGVIASCRPGTTGDEIYRSGMGWMEKHHDVVRQLGLCPDDVGEFTSTFGRDVGHLLGTQEPATVAFERGNSAVLEPGMLAAAEIQWPYRDKCIGVEDIFLITEDAPINITRND
jgi:Xaa-Pro aminopeptidase